MKKIKFGFLFTASIGHLCLEADMAAIKKNTEKTFTLWLRVPDIANKSIYELIKKEFKFVEGFPFNLILKLFVRITRRNSFNANAQVNNFTTHLQDNSEINFPIPTQWNVDFEMLKRNMNMELTKYVCLIVRDNLHTKTYVGNKQSFETSYRNSEIDSYKIAIDKLISNGYEVIRMGRLAYKASFKQKAFFDYANSPYRTDRNDLILIAKCNFVVSTQSGLDEIANLYRKPVYVVNHLPIGDIRCSELRPYYFLKRLKDKKTNCYLSIDEIYKRGLLHANNSKFYLDKGVEEENLSSMDLAKAMDEILLIHRNNKKAKCQSNLSISIAEYSKVPENLMYKFPYVSELWIKSLNE